MKRLSLYGPAWLVLMSVTLFVSHSEATARTARVGREFKVKVGRVVTLDGNRLMVRFARVAEDSRCPVDVNCVWAGNAEVVLEVGGKRWRDKQTLTLNTNAAAQGASEAKYGRYNVRLVGLSPQPRSNRKISQGQYTATLLVSKE